MPGRVEGADILIIGGGIAGISAAARLAEHASVILLEAESATGYHSTGRSAAMYIENYGSPVISELTCLSGPAFRDHQELSETPLLLPRGDLTIATSGEEEAVEAMLDRDPSLQRLTPAEASQLHPALKPEYTRLAAYEPAASDIDVAALLQGFTRLFRQRGGRIITSARVEEIHRAGEGWAVSTAAGRFAADMIINAAGAWADQVAAMAGASTLGIQPYRRSAALVALPPETSSADWPMVANVTETWYCRPDAGRLMVSPAEEDPLDPQDAWADDTVLAEGIYRFQQAMNIDVRRIEHSWAGLRSFAPDRNMVIGYDADCAGFFWLAGQGGYGIATSPAVSQLAADLCLRQASSMPEHLIAAVSPSRFK